MEQFLQNYGYWGAFIGTLLEGEILLLSSVLTSKMGYLNFYGAIAAAFTGAWARDWILFIFARKSGKKFIEQRPKLEKKMRSVKEKMKKYPSQIITVNRMFYGFSAAIILVAGVSDISTKKFGLLSGLSAAIWVLFYSIFGWFFAEIMIENFTWINEHKLLIISFLLIIGLVLFIIKKIDFSKLFQ